MKKQFYSLSSKLALAVVMAFSALTAMAGNRLVLGDGGDILIKPGETKEIPVTIESDNDFYALQVDFGFTTNKLTVDESTFRVNTDVAFNVNFTVTCNQLPNGAYRIAMLPANPMKLKCIPAGTKDVLGYITLTAADDFTGKKSDNTADYKSSNVGVWYENGFATNKTGKENYYFEDTYTAVVPNVGSIAATESEFSIKPGASHKVEFVLNNEIDMNGVDGWIMLPEGMDIEKDAEGDYVFTHGDRMPSPYQVYSSYDTKEGGIHYLVTGLTPNPLGGQSGDVLFSFNVVAGKSFATTDESYITVKTPTASAYPSCANYDLENLVNIKVNSTIFADNETLMTRIDSALQVALATATAADEKLSGDYKDVKDAYDSTLAELTSKINTIDVEAKKKLAALELTEENTQAYVDSLTAIKNQIESLMAEAAAAHEKVTINETANAAIQEALSAAIATATAADEKLSGDLADVKDAYDDKLAELTSAINALGVETAEKYAAIELTEESGKAYVDSLNNLKSQIDSLMAEATAAHEQLGINETANAAIQEALNTAIATATAADEKLSGDLADVKDAYDDKLAELTSAINALGVEAAEKYAAIELTEESGKAYVDSLNNLKSQIDSLMAEAAATHEKLAANETAIETLNKVLLDASNTANEAADKVEENCPDVKDEYLDELADVTSAINALGVEISEKYAALELDSATAKEYADSLEALKKHAQEILAEAEAAQAAHEKAVKDNQDAYDRLKSELDEVQKSLNDAIKTIEDEYADVASQFVGVEAAIQQELDRLYRELEQAYKNQELGEDSSLDIQYLKDQIAKLLEDAKKAVALGIDGIMTVNGVDCTAIYSLDGKKLDTPARGKVNVLKYADGTIRKIFIK